MYPSVCLALQKVNGLHSFVPELVVKCFWFSGFSDTASETAALFALRHLSSKFGAEMRAQPGPEHWEKAFRVPFLL